MVSTPADVIQPLTVPVIGHVKRAHSKPFDFSKLLRSLAVFAVIGVLSALCYLGISRYLVQSIEVVGESMVPTLSQGSHYILNRMAYNKATPQHGDIVVIRDPADHGFSVKRIVAVSGESVHFFQGKVFVNSEQLNESYLLPGTLTFTYSQAKEQMITCGKDQYFVLGDNRPASVDSRSYGPVSSKDILGQVVLNK